MIVIRKIAGDEANSNHMEFQIGSEAELADLPTTTKKDPETDMCAAVGSIAYTAGFKKIWHLSDTDVWEEV